MTSELQDKAEENIANEERELKYETERLALRIIERAQVHTFLKELPNKVSIERQKLTYVSHAYAAEKIKNKLLMGYLTEHQLEQFNLETNWF